MLSWILTSSAIAAFSAATLEMFRESGRSALAQSAGWWAARSAQKALRWETMTDAEMEELLQEFNCADTEAAPHDRSLAA